MTVSSDRGRLSRLHAVTDARVVALPNLLSLTRAIGQSSDVAVQLRAANLGGRALLEVARALKDVMESSGARLFVNDRIDVAQACSAHGVHLPEHGLPLDAARRLIGPDRPLGRSVHSARDARAAHEDGADYVFLGPIWQTASHPGRPLGLEAITQSQPARVIAIGGVTPPRAAACRDAGAYGVAAIRALWDADDPGTAVSQMLLSLES